MFARIRDTEIYFDIEGAGLVPDGGRMVERPPTELEDPMTPLSQYAAVRTLRLTRLNGPSSGRNR